MSEVTALFDQEGNHIFSSVGILSLSADQQNQFAEHTLEDGTVVSDNKIKLQDRITIQAVLSPDDYVNTFKKLQEASNNDDKFTIQTRVATYTDMYIESIPYEESSKLMGTISLNISFVEQQFVGVKSESLPPQKVKNPADTDTINSGTKLPKVDRGTILQGIFG